MKQEIEIFFFSILWEVEAEFTVPLVSITLNSRTVLGIFSEHSLGWGVFRALSFVRDVLLRDLAPGWMVLRDLSTGGGVLGDRSLDLADPRDLSTGWRDLGDLSFDW